MRNTIRASEIAPANPSTSRATNASPRQSPTGRAMASIFCPLSPQAVNVEASRARAPSFPRPQDAPPMNHLNLSADELVLCERAGVIPQDFAQAKAETAGDVAKAARAVQAANAERCRHGGLSAAERDICERTGVQPSDFTAAKRAAFT